MIINYQNTTNDLVAIIRRGAGKNAQAALNQLLAEAAKWKPRGYNNAVVERRDYYEDNQTSYIKAELQNRYKNTHDRMSPYTVPLFKHLCEHQATVYNAAPRREIVENLATTIILNNAYAAAGANHRLAKAEEIAAAVKLCFLRLGWHIVDLRVDIQPYWPNIVDVIPNPNDPTRLESAFAIIAEITSEHGVNADAEKKRYELWTRNGDMWTGEIVGANGSERMLLDKPVACVPWVAFPFDLPMGSLFASPPDDDIEVNKSQNVMLTDLLHTISMQSFDHVTYSGPEPLPATLKAGPGDILEGGDGQFGSISYNPSIKPVLEAADQLMKQHLVLKNVSPSTATIDAKFQSGIALEIENMPMIEKRRKRLPVVEDMEERHLWRVFKSVCKDPEFQKIPSDAKLKFRAGQIKLPQDQTSEFNLSKSYVEAGVSTWPKEMVRLGLAHDAAEAEQMYKPEAVTNGDQESESKYADDERSQEG